MARIAGVDLPRNKRVEIALTYLFGIGRSLSNEILGKAGIDPNKKSDDLNDDEVVRIRQVIDQSYKVEGDLRRDVAMNIKRHMDLGTYRGLRHRRNLPVHGQRTRTNSRTRKGPKKTVAGRGRRPAWTLGRDSPSREARGKVAESVSFDGVADRRNRGCFVENARVRAQRSRRSLHRRRASLPESTRPLSSIHRRRSRPR